MLEWTLQHPWMTFILVAMALQVALVWGQAMRKRERIIRIDPPPPMQSIVRVEHVCPRCQAIEEIRQAVEAVKGEEAN